MNMFEKVFLIILFLIVSEKDILKYSVQCCSDFCANTSITKNCFCTHCNEYDDCCADKPQTNRLDAFSECNIRLDEFNYAYSISKCDEQLRSLLSKREVDRCENVEADSVQKDIFSFLPVYSNQTKQAFKNVFCAKCNFKDVRLAGLAFFKIKSSQYSESLSADKMELTQNVLEEYLIAKTLGKNGENNNFTLEFEMPIENQQIRLCVQAIDSCQNNATDLEVELCTKTPTAYRFLTKIVF